MIDMGSKNSLIDGVDKEVKDEKKKGLKTKNDKDGFKTNKEQIRFLVDIGKDTDVQRKIFELLEKANNKEYGREITFKDLAILGITKISSKDIEKIQEGSMTEMEKVERVFNEYKLKTGEAITLGEFLVKKLNIA